MNKVYLSQIEVYSTRFGKLSEKNSLQSQLYFSHDEAHEEGKDYLQICLEKCYKNSDYCDGTPESDTLDDFIEHDEVRYRWTITEIDLDLLHNYEFPKDNNYHLYTPAHVEYEYDLNGELLQRNHWWFIDGVNGSSGSCIQNREGDDLPEAGTKFNIGDFVRLKRPLRSSIGKVGTDTIFVIDATPRRADDGRLIENTYQLCTAGDDGKYLWDLDFHYPFQGIHENELVKHEGDVDEGGPLAFLSRLAKGEFANAEKIYAQLIDQKILLTSGVTWRDIPELKILSGEGEN